MQRGDVARVHAVVKGFLRPFFRGGRGCCFEIHEVEGARAEKREGSAPG